MGYAIFSKPNCSYIHLFNPSVGCKTTYLWFGGRHCFDSTDRFFKIWPTNMQIYPGKNGTCHSDLPLTRPEVVTIQASASITHDGQRHADVLMLYRLELGFQAASRLEVYKCSLSKCAIPRNSPLIAIMMINDQIWGTLFSDKHR